MLILLLWSIIGLVAILTKSSRHGFNATIAALGILGFFTLLRTLLDFDLDKMSDFEKEIIFTCTMGYMTVVGLTYIKNQIDRL
tara:strand:+ start:3198 stop:3446 length:249 start_codon:yes stop_codon:yes gene_type:complete